MSSHLSPEKMNASELRASISLASIYGLRMLGMFLILPIFAIYASNLPGGENHFLIGLALGAYGLTQAIFQLPFGMASDRFGRKRDSFNIAGNSDFCLALADDCDALDWFSCSLLDD